MKRNSFTPTLVLIIPAAIIVLVFFLLQLAGCMVDREPTAPTEITRPQPFTLEPSNGTLKIGLSSAVKMVFDEPMNLSTFNGRFTLKDKAGNMVEGTFEGSDSVITFRPSSALQKATIYYAELKGRVRDANNNSIEVNGEAVLDDTTVIFNNWFYTQGDYSTGGYYNIYLRDKKDGSIRVFSYLDSMITKISSLSAPEGMITSSDGNYIFVSNTGKNKVEIYNSSTFTLETSLDVPANPSNLAANGDYVYVISVNGKAITKIKASTKSVESTFSLSFYPGKLAISSDGTILYTFDQTKRDLYLINSSNGSTIKKISSAVDKLVSGEIKFDNNSSTLYICDSEGFKLRSLDKDGAALQTIFTYPNNVKPVDVAFNEQFLYVASGKSIYKYDKATNTAVDTVTFLNAVKALTLLPSNEIIFATLATSISIIDEKTFFILEEKDLASSGIESIISSTKKF